MKLCTRSTGCQLLLALALGGTAAADFNPIPLTPASYNADIIVEKEAPPPVAAGTSTTVTLDGGTANNGFTWYEVGFNAGSPASGIPAAGQTFTHLNDAAKTYTMPPTYDGNCVVFISSVIPSGSFTPATPVAVTDLSFLSASGGGAVTIGYTLTFEDNSTESGTFLSGDWFGGASQAWTADGRIDPSNGGYNSVGTGNPRLYSQEVVVTGTLKVTKIDFSHSSGAGRCSILAVTGGNAGVWTPLAVTGYNHDAVVGVGEVSLTPLTTASTVSMDGGTANSGNTWYERGYHPGAPTTGLPIAGSTITSTALPDHHYLMPADYTLPNAIYVDSANPVKRIEFADPKNYSALSFLNATANGAVTVQCTMNYQDGTSEVQTFTAKDWFNGTPFAYNSAGRVNLNNRLLNNVNGSNPRLYEAEFVLGNTVSPITSVDMEWLSGGATSRVAVLAVSATAGALKPILGDVPQPVNLLSGGRAEFSATITGGNTPVTYRWQKGSGTTFTDLTNGGSISGADTLTLVIDPALVTDESEYRLVATNIAGPTTTPAVALTVISTLPDVTAPGDTITAFGGTSPAGEAVEFVIDNAAQKYLNFGSGPNAGGSPFVGPVGFIVTPAAGASTIQGIRIYTANDTVGRDPVDFAVEGSNDDGLNWAPIASGPLALPEGRNGTGGVALDPLTQFLRQVMFTNTVQYTSYRVTFQSVKDPGGVNSMQIAEVELLGTVVVTPPELSISRNATSGVIEIGTSRTCILQTSLTMTGPDPVWTDLGEITPAASYSFIPAAGEPARFYRPKP